MTTAKAKTFPIVVQEWEESERGWGVRPDGASLHLSKKDRASYIKDYWDREKVRNPGGATPDEYSRPCGAPQIIDIDEATYGVVAKSANGVMLLESAYRALRRACR